ncbi:hypothetical protein [Fibrobacter succinogenes]|uniref:hypothetical protein n=1 Tax=Fibrobacter succinogenes TaxID=833 RepID=UPI001567F30F|nr:hypothetical protein [Fibrobacter succinogenes]
MKNLIYLIFIFFVACSDPGVNPGPTETPQDRWVNVFTPDMETLNTRGSGLQKVLHSGSWIMVEDAWSIPAEGKPGYLVHAPRLFISTVNGNHWDTLSVPSKGFVHTLYSDSTAFYIGTTTGDVLKYLPDSKEWIKINVLDSSDGIEYGVYGIAKFENNLIVCLAGFKDTVTKEVKSVLRLQNGDSWIDLETPPIHYDTYDADIIPLQFHKGVEWNGKFYAATLDGVFELESGSRKWRQLPFPPKVLYTKVYIANPVQDILIHKNKLVIADEWSGLVYEWNHSNNNWISMDSLFLSPHDKDSFAKDSLDYTIHVNSILYKHALVSDGVHLFSFGKRSYPKVYMGDYGEPHGNIPKGWRKIVGEIINGKHIPTSLIYGGDVIDGMLYAASYEGLYKIPLKNLDRIIANEKDFF